MKWNKGKATIAALSIVLSSNMGISVQAAEGDSKSGQGGQMTQEEALKLLDEQMQKMDTAIRTGMSQAAEKYKSANFPTDLPPRDKVVEAKDSKSLNMYGGLCEKYLFQDNVEKAEDLRNWIAKNASTICGADDPSPGLIDGDFALYYYDKGDFKKAEPLCINSIKLLEPAVASHKVSFLSLISTYACEAEICWKTNRKEEATKYIKKIVELQQANRGEAPPESGAESPKTAPEGGK